MEKSRIEIESIKIALKSKGKTSYWLAKEINLPRGTLSKYFNYVNKMPLEVYLTIKKVLGDE